MSCAPLGPNCPAWSPSSLPARCLFSPTTPYLLVEHCQTPVMKRQIKGALVQVAGKAIAGEEEEPPLSASARSTPASTLATTSPSASAPAQPKQSLSAPSRLSAPRRLKASQSSPAAAPTASATLTPPPGVFCCAALSTSILTLGWIPCLSTFPLCPLQTGCLKETSCSCTGWVYRLPTVSSCACSAFSGLHCAGKENTGQDLGAQVSSTATRPAAALPSATERAKALSCGAASTMPRRSPLSRFGRNEQVRLCMHKSLAVSESDTCSFVQGNKHSLLAQIVRWALWVQLTGKVLCAGSSGKVHRSISSPWGPSADRG